MGRYFFRLPDIGEGVAEAEIVAWHVKPGDVVREDDPLVDVMTDKATVDITSPVDGVVLAIHGELGAQAPVGSTLVELEVAGEGAEDAPAAGTPVMPAPVAPPPAPPPPVVAPVAPTPPAPVVVPVPMAAQRPAGDPPLASPSTRRRALDLGIALENVTGSGPGGRIIPADLDAYLAIGQSASAGGPSLVARTGVTETRIVGLRRKIAEKMEQSKRRIPHFSYVEECDLTELEALRQELNASRRDDQPKLTLLPFLMRAMVRILPDFPNINARYDDEAGVLSVSEGIHIGIATQTPGGLIVPVVRHAEARDLWDCAREMARVTAAARDGSADRAVLSGSTITLTSLGTLGGIAATPVINHPEVAIIGPNKLVDRPVVQGSFVTVRKMMNLSSSFDHRIVDGYDAARFIHALKRMIEHPALIFMG